MFERRFGDTFAAAERVPVWTRPRSAAFTAFKTTPGQRVDPDFDAQPTADPVIEEYARGFQDGYAAAHAAGQDEGSGLERLTTALADLTPEPTAALGAILSEAVMRLVRQVMGEVSLDAGAIAERADTVAALVADEVVPARLRLHPEDIARIDTLESPLALVADPSLTPGTVVAETANGWVEDGPSVRMERLRAALDTMASRR